MTAPLEEFSRRFAREFPDYPEYAEGLRALADLGRKTGLPRELPHTAVLFETKTRESEKRPLRPEELVEVGMQVGSELLELGISKKAADSIHNAIAHTHPLIGTPPDSPFKNIRTASDLSGISDKDLLRVIGIGPKYVTEIRDRFPYQPAESSYTQVPVSPRTRR